MTADPNPLIVALDTGDLAHLDALAGAVAPFAGRLKVGLEAFTAGGPAAVAAAAAHAPVFLDLKLHDIPNTVAGAARAVAGMGIDLLTVHAGGGPAMVAAAAQAAPQVGILAVTVLTSLDDAALEAVGQPPVAEQVPRLAALAVRAGATGVVCAPTDLAAVRDAVGGDPLVVTPGIRPQALADDDHRRAEAPDDHPRAEAPDDHPRAEAPDDQVRVATPRAALEAGADLLVVGRPVTAAPDPAAAAAGILAELRA